MSYQKPIKKIERILVKTMVDYLGIPIKQQPKDAEGVRKQLEVFRDSDRDAYDRAYSIIVDHVVPGDDEKIIIQTMEYSDASILLTDAAASIEFGIENNLKASFRKEKDDLVIGIRTDLQNAIATESKKYQTIMIKDGKKKLKQVKGVVPENFPRMLQLAKARKNILLVGPSGSGKTFVAAQIAEALELDYASQSCSAGISESAFVGWLIPVGKGGQFVYVSSEFVRIYENGGVFLFDEMDASDPNVLVFLNQALANGGFSIPQRHENPYVKKHKDFVAIGASNTNGSGADELYHGRNALDEATLDRFRVGTIFMDYSDQVESNIITNEAVLEWGRTIRSHIKTNKLKRLMSTRCMIDANDMMNDHDWSITDIELGYFSSWSPEELRIIGRSELVRN